MICFPLDGGVQEGSGWQGNDHSRVRIIPGEKVTKRLEQFPGIILRHFHIIVVVESGSFIIRQKTSVVASLDHKDIRSSWPSSWRNGIGGSCRLLNRREESFDRFEGILLQEEEGSIREIINGNNGNVAKGKEKGTYWW